MVPVVGIATILVLVLGSVIAYSSVRIVDEGELEALFVFGRMEAVLQPGLNVVPPLVSKTYPIDPRTTTIDRGDRRVEIPTEFEAEVREAANVAPGDDPEGETETETETKTKTARGIDAGSE